jgi:SOR/SNZ family protein
LSLFASSFPIALVSTHSFFMMMASEQQTGVATNGTASSQPPTFTVKAGLAQMLKGGVIMDVINADQVSFFLLF